MTRFLKLLLFTMDAEVGSTAPPAASSQTGPGPTTPQKLTLSGFLSGSTGAAAAPSPANAEGEEPANEREDIRGLSDDFGKLLESGQAYDVTFLVGVSKVAIRAHQAILVARSEYFRFVYWAEPSHVHLNPNLRPYFSSLLTQYLQKHVFSWNAGVQGSHY